MTKIQSIEAYSATDKIDIQDFESFETFSQPLKVKLFAFDDSTDNEYYSLGFEE